MIYTEVNIMSFMKSLINKTVKAILVFGLIFTGMLVTHCSVYAQQPISLSSKSGIVIEATTGKVLYEHNAHEPLPPASVTKIMTLVLALEAIKNNQVNWDDLVTTSAYAKGMGGTQIWLEVGEQMPLEDLLWAIAVGSANDAAVAVAEHLAGSEPAFAERMTARARELGALNTHFLSASGLSLSDLHYTGEHVTTAYDLAMISKHAITLPRFIEMVSTWGPVVMRQNTSKEPELYTYNKMLKSYPGMDGIKTGYTDEAGFCLSATAYRNQIRVIAVVLGAPTREQRESDITKLLDYGFSQLKSIKVATGGEIIEEIPVKNGKQNTVGVMVENDVYATVLKNEDPSAISREVQISTGGVVAPFSQGDVIGHLVIKVGDEQIAQEPLVASQSVEKAGWLRILFRNIKRLMAGQ
jgi:D-alanyl-D-alanine carboxypeptidase (penicillin-binding protein 5/6)